MKKIQRLLIASLFLLYFVVPTPASAQGVPGNCLNLGDKTNKFSCEAQTNASMEWGVTAQWCDANHQVDNGVCTGGYPNVTLCGANTSCCIPCKPRVATGNEIPWGGTCTDATATNCVNGTVCRNGRCLKQALSINLGLECKTTDECRIGTGPTSPNEALVCRVQSGTTTTCALATPDGTCESDAECRSATGNPSARCAGSMCVVTTPSLGKVPFNLCDQIPLTPDPDLRQTCLECEAQKGIWSAVGCIKTAPQSIIKTVVSIGLSIGGGVALLMILASAFLFSTSQGDLKRVTDARELLTSAVIGLLFIIFSVTILQFIGVTILRIPGFGS